MTNNHPTNKDELFRLQLEGRKRWEELLARVPAKRIAEPGVEGKRSVKDIVAHIAAWERHAAGRLRAIAHGTTPEPLPPPGMSWREYEHAFNARVDEAWRDRSWEEVHAEAAAAYVEFLLAGETLPENVLFRAEQPAWEIVAYNGYLHYLGFVDELSAWLRRAG